MMEHVETLAKHQFTLDTEYDILRIMMQDIGFMSSYAKHLRPEIFTDGLRPIVSSILKQWNQFGSLAKQETILQDSSFTVGVNFNDVKLEKLKEVLAQIAKHPISAKYTTSVLETFLDLYRMDTAMGECFQLLAQLKQTHNRDFVTKIRNTIEKACEPIALDSPAFTTEIETRTEQRKELAEGIQTRSGISTGIPELNKMMPYDGLERKQLGMFLAPTGAGKSLALKHVSYAAALSGFKVVYISLELPKDMLLDRIDSMISQIPTFELVNRYLEVEKEVKFMLSQPTITGEQGNIAFLEMPPSSNLYNVKDWLRDLERRYQYIPDVVVIDYMDLMVSTKKFKEGAWRDQQEVARELRAFGGEINAVIWTASQTNRSAINKVEEGGVISDAEAAESYSKQSVADLIVSINQTKEQRKMETEPKPLTLFVVKNRTGIGGKKIDIMTAFSKMCFYDGPYDPSLDLLHSPAITAL